MTASKNLISQDTTESPQELISYTDQSRPPVNFAYISAEGTLVIGSSTSEEYALSTIPNGVIYKLHIGDDLATMDKEYLDAYVLADDAFTLDISKAREVKKRYLRIERKPLLEALDVDFMLALETGDEAKRVSTVQKKQALRDITSLVDAADTLEEIKQISCIDF